MSQKNIKVIGKGGGGESPKKPYVPIEEPNSLQANTVGRIVDMICEGEISGPANNNSWYESTYFNETPVKTGAEWNFTGVEIEGRNGSAVQDYLRGFDAVEVEITVGVKVLELTPITRTISDTDVDDLRITISTPSLFEQTDVGDIIKTVIYYEFTITPDGGAETGVGINANTTGGLYGKTITEYRKQHTITNLSQYGNGPWVIKVYRRIVDSGSLKLQNDLYWHSYTTVKNIKIGYMDRAVIGVTIDAKQFGDVVPSRAYKIKGRIIKYPQNYNPSTRVYTGDWNGNFVTGYCNNPAWVLYDMLFNDRFGVGLSTDQIDKWTLYTIAQYCDTNIQYVEKTRQNDGSYSSEQKNEPRFTFNGVISNREQALAVINHFSSVFRGFPIWSTGMVSFINDTPKEVSRVASLANVTDGFFEYEGSPRTLRHTAAKVSWNNPELFGRQDVVIIEDDEGISKYGYNPIDITCFGCTSKPEAMRRARYILYTDINQTEMVKFQGGLEWADCLPGEVISVQDENYAAETLSGRVVSGTTTSVDIDRTITIPSGECKIIVQTRWFDVSDGKYKDVREFTLSNAPGDTSTLTWVGATDEAPLTDAVWVVTIPGLTTRQFMVVGVAEIDKGVFGVQAALYDPDKYDIVEDGIVIETEPTTALPVGAVTPPSNIEIQPYSYTEGDQSVRKYAMIISWVGSPDVRVDSYELRYKRNSAGWVMLPNPTSQLSYDWRDVEAGTYDISVRAKGLAGTSTWVTYSDFVMTSNVTGPEAVTGLQVKGGGTQFDGPDCQIEWTGSAGSDYTDGDVGGGAGVGDSNVKNYKVEVRKADNTLLRTAHTDGNNELEYTYNLAMNKEDTGGTPIRNIQFRVYTVDMYDDLSAATSLFANNPAPAMTTPTVEPKFNALKVSWDPVTDNDMSHYRVYIDTFSPPTTEVGRVVHPDHIFEMHDLLVGTSYYTRVVPYDEFGVGSGYLVVGGSGPLEIPSINVDVELTNSITMTDSKGSSAASLAALLDKTYSTGGIAYNASSWIQYAYEIENYFDRVAVWCSGATTVYVSVADEGQTNIRYYKYSAGELVIATNQADAIANPWSVLGGNVKNTILMPDNITGYEVRLNLIGATTVREWVPSRILIAELAAIEHLSAISADMGTLQAGNIQSDNYGANTGMNIDMDSKVIYMGGSSSPIFAYNDATKTLTCTGKFVFVSGSTGYSNITDKPTNLSQINSNQGTKLTNIEDFATDDSDIRHADDETTIDGGKINVGSKITLNEGGVALFGDSNVIIDTQGNHGSIVVSEDGGPATNSYCELTDGDINFQYWNGSNHIQYKSLTRIEAGIGQNNTPVNIPGIFKSPPYIMVSPNVIGTYNTAYTSQSQTLKCTPESLIEYATGQWKFTPRATLQLSSGSIGGVAVNYAGAGAVTDLTTPVYTAIAPNTRKMVVSVQTNTNYTANAQTLNTATNAPCGGKDGPPCIYITTYRSQLWAVVATMYLYYYYSGAWHSLASAYNALGGSHDFDTGFVGGDITHIYARVIISTTGTYQGTRSGQIANGYHSSLSLVSYSSDQVATNIIEGGTLNYICIGQ